jgi:hypothetical protein
MATSGQLISIKAMEKELKTISAKAERYKKEVDESINIGHEFLFIHEDLLAIINEKSTDHELVLKKLDELKVRETRANKIIKRDICSLVDKQVKAECEANSLISEIYYAKLRAGVK